MKVHVIRINGQTSDHEIRQGTAFREIGKLIGAVAFDTVNLRDGRVMIVDDTGLMDGKQVNPEATKLYHGVCKLGVVHPICGDVAIALDADFA